MRFADPLRLKSHLPKETIIFAASQLQGSREIQEDYFINFNDECFVIADGVGGVPHGEVAARLACETALWGFKHIRQRPFYWADKKLLLKRMFRSSNLAVWQKRREEGFEAGLETTLLVAMFAAHKVWVGTVGDSSALLFREGLIDEMARHDVNENGNLTKVIGMQRLGIVPSISIEKFLPRDILLLATDGVMNYVSEDQLRATFEVVGDTIESVTNAVVHILRTAQEQGSDDNMTACVVKHLPENEI